MTNELGTVYAAGRTEVCLGFPCLFRVSDAGRLKDVAAYSAAGVRKPSMKETALRERRAVPQAPWDLGTAGELADWNRADTVATA